MHQRTHTAPIAELISIMRDLLYLEHLRNLACMSEKSSPNSSKHRKKAKQPKKVTRDYLYNSGLYYLQRYTASQAHFRSVMEMKIKRSITFHGQPSLEETKPWLDEVTQIFIEDGFLNDKAYAQGMVTSLRRRGLSARAIMMRLKVKGLEADLVQEALKRFDESATYEAGLDEKEADYLAALSFAKRKRYGPYASDPLDWSDQKAVRRVLSAFARAGFSYDLAKRVLEDHLP